MTDRSSHPSFAWITTRRPADAEFPKDPASFAELMTNDAFPRASAYAPTWVHGNSMGPNPLWLVDDLTTQMNLPRKIRVLDLGCGTAITSIFIAREYDAEVWAGDLWIDPTENQRRIAEADLSDQVFPLELEAHSLPFAHGFFDAVISIDSYHWWGTEIHYLSYLANFVRTGGLIGVTMPGNANDPDATTEAPPTRHRTSWYTFRSSDWWARHCSRAAGVTVRQARMVANGWDHWMRYCRAAAAWKGTRAEEDGDARMLLSEAGKTLGFAQVIAERTDEPTQIFGPGRFQHRLF